MNIEYVGSKNNMGSRIEKLLLIWRDSIKCLDIDDYYIEVCEDNLCLKSKERPKDKGIIVDFLTGSVDYRRKFGGGKNQMIAKAIGAKQGVFPSVVDATAGIGRDAFVLASLGCRVHMMERSIIMALLLTDGLQRAALDSTIGSWVKERLTLDFKDSVEGFKDLPFKPDVIYMDPMYSKKKKSALVKKEMRVLKDIVGDDVDSSDLLNNALNVAQDRVVVKRSIHADFINDQKPNMSLKTLKNRFDLYLIKKESD